LITFYTWLKKFQNQDNSIGDLSRDAQNDSSFPITKNYDIILEHLKSSNASGNALDTFKKAFYHYQKNILNETSDSD